MIRIDINMNRKEPKSTEQPRLSRYSLQILTQKTPPDFELHYQLHQENVGMTGLPKFLNYLNILPSWIVNHKE
jgi:hypothetical protein